MVIVLLCVAVLAGAIAGFALGRKTASRLWDR